MSKTDTAVYEAAHKFSAKNKDSLKSSTKCGCFYCLRIFDPKEIVRWTDGGETAICPYCDIDSIIGDSSGYPITKEFLDELYKFSFS